MNVLKIISSAVIGTTAMTLFSYQASEARQKQFKEPELLSTLIKKLLPYDGPYRWNNSSLDGWISHYMVGLMFTAAYDQIWKKTRVTPTIKNGLLLGTVSGLLGVMAWKKTFDLHPDPPNIHFKRYYSHLLLAHLVFGVFTTLAYKISDIKPKHNAISPN